MSLSKNEQPTNENLALVRDITIILTLLGVVLGTGAFMLSELVAMVY
jgi:hypothetical protein